MDNLPHTSELPHVVPLPHDSVRRTREAGSKPHDGMENLLFTQDAKVQAIWRTPNQAEPNL